MTDDPFGLATPPTNLPATLLKAAWMSVALALALQILASSITGFESASSFALDLARKVPFSFIVCVGLAVGAAVSQRRPMWMGVAGFVAGAVGFVMARAAQRAASGDPVLAFTHLSIGLMLLEAIEYAMLGATVAWIGKRGAGLLAHALVGGLFGIFFSTVITVATFALAAPRPPATKLAATAVNEFVFPIGCSVILFAAQALGKRVADSRY